MEIDSYNAYNLLTDFPDLKDTLAPEPATNQTDPAQTEQVSPLMKWAQDSTTNFEQQLLSREYVESLQPHVSKVDSDGTLDLFCYTNCSDEDSEDIKACRGVVFDDQECILKTFSYTPELTATDNYDELQAIFDHTDIASCLVFDSYEGSLIRIFYHDKWYISTHRRLDAFKSKWSSSISFGEIFVRSLYHEFTDGNLSAYFRSFAHIDVTSINPSTILELFLSTLNTNNQYMFLVQNTIDNRIVCTAPDRYTVYHVGSYVNQSLSFEENVGIPYPTQRKFGTLYDMLVYTEDRVNIENLQGIMVFTPTKHFKVVNSLYKSLFKVRGNEPSLKYRYLQIRTDLPLVEDLMYLYPHMIDTFDLYENTIYDLIPEIKEAYIRSFIKKERQHYPQETYKILKKLHRWHTIDRTKNRINIHQIRETLNACDATTLNRMIRRHIQSKNTENENESDSEETYTQV